MLYKRPPYIIENAPSPKSVLKKSLLLVFAGEVFFY